MTSSAGGKGVGREVGGEKGAARRWFKGASWRASLPIALGIALGAGTLILIMKEMGDAMGGYVRGVAINAVIMGSQTDVPQTLVIFAITAGAALGGLLGVLTALPLAAALRVFTLRVVAPTERDMVGAGPGA